jgi:hypothetical protein
LLLRLRRLEEARLWLERCLHLPACDRETQASAFYDLACVHARTGREDECREALNQSRLLRPVEPNWLLQDPDLESVRTAAWFKAMLPNTPAQP